jgi:hypothetical protein
VGLLAAKPPLLLAPPEYTPLLSNMPLLLPTMPSLLLIMLLLLPPELG